MYPFAHFLLPLLIGQILVKLNLFSYKLAFAAALVGLLLDVDHFVWYVYKYKSWNLRKAWNADVRYHVQERTFIHHKLGFVIGTIITVILLIININIGLVAAIGFYSHFFLDHIPLNLFHIKGQIKENIDGFLVRIPIYEIIINIILLIGVIVLFVV
jgi:hypothetical protein